MHNEKSYFRKQNGSLAICHIGVVTIEQYEPAQYLVQRGRYNANLHRGRATGLYLFFVEEVVNPSEIYRKMKVQ